MMKGLQRIPFVGPAYRTRSLDQSAQRCVNWYLESTEQGGVTQAALLPTPGLRLACAIPYDTPDPYWADVVSLMHFDGPDGTTTIEDEKGGTWTAAGGAALSTSVPKFGTASLETFANGDYINQSITFPYSTSSYYLGDTYTIEFFMYAATLGAMVPWFMGPTTQANYAVLQLEISASGEILAKCRPTTGGSLTTLSSAAGVIDEDTWHHVALVSNAGTATVYVDGVSVASGALPTLTENATAFVALGGLSNGTTPTYSLVGKIDEYRATPGIARYTGAFTPPTQEFPNF